ncbi:MAG: hypothetical protein U5K33_10780 [Halofilum sp. (in: g-proteobacteria)]|nr:hypothetical protein [Halofilum sp. (in: g-proteobacteria)]
MRYRVPLRALQPCRRLAAKLLVVPCLLVPAIAHSLGPASDARERTWLEYSRNLVAAYPAALEERIRRMQRRASVELSVLDTCRRAAKAVAEDLEDNSGRRIALVAAGPIGREPDAWERRALTELATAGRRALHAFVPAETAAGEPTREMFRYIERLDGLPAPCNELLADDSRGPAVSIQRLAGTAAGGARTPERDAAVPPLRLPHPQRQGPKR